MITKVAKRTANKSYRNVTVDAADAEALNEFQNKLETHLGFRPTVSQTLRWLISNASRLLEKP